MPLNFNVTVNDHLLQFEDVTPITLICCKDKSFLIRLGIKFALNDVGVTALLSSNLETNIHYSYYPDIIGNLIARASNGKHFLVSTDSFEFINRCVDIIGLDCSLTRIDIINGVPNLIHFSGEELKKCMPHYTETQEWFEGIDIR